MWKNHMWQNVKYISLFVVYITCKVKSTRSKQCLGNRYFGLLFYAAFNQELYCRSKQKAVSAYFTSAFWLCRSDQIRNLMSAWLVHWKLSSYQRPACLWEVIAVCYVSPQNRYSTWQVWAEVKHRLNDVHQMIQNSTNRTLSFLLWTSYYKFSNVNCYIPFWHFVFFTQQARDVVTMLGQLQRRWPNIKTTSSEGLLFMGWSWHCSFWRHTNNYMCET